MLKQQEVVMGMDKCALRELVQKASWISEEENDDKDLRPCE